MDKDELFWVMQQDEEKFLTAVKEMPEKDNRGFYFYAAARCYTNWEKEYDKTFAEENVRDIGIWMRDNMRRTGRICIDNHAWVRKGLVGEVVRLGRLQFEKISDAQRGTVLNVHIPEDGPLCPEDVKASFARAEAFYGLSDFVCTSWLLAPELKRYLDENSNIRRFQDLFVVTEVDYANRQAEERVFGSVLADPAQYAAKTRLQKRLREGLKTNGNPGVAKGYIK